ncbi:MAG: GAF domain-containing protein [Candidatus Eremiobacteraeota bacterium]|nr:GAF domain-containing protein [Candidatus Eremiobacteraeota bacterium]
MTTLDPTNEDEAARLEAVRRYQILDTPADQSFDRITALAAELFDVPIALVSIVDHDRIWFKSRYGLEAVEQIDRDPGLCASAIMSDEPYVVEAAREDPRTLANPLVSGKFGLQFYAASPIRAQGGRLGTICIIDREPRVFSPRQAEILQRLSDIVVDQLELRLGAMVAIREAKGAPAG